MIRNPTDICHSDSRILNVLLTYQKWNAMTAIEKTSLSFYQKTGELFYAIAAADKVVRKKEYQSLKKMVQQEWKGLDDVKDEFGVDADSQGRGADRGSRPRPASRAPFH